MKIKMLTIFIMFFCLCSCITKKENYKVLSKVIDKNVLQKDCDSSKIVKSTVQFEMQFFKYYEEAKLKDLNNDLPFHHPYITWFNKKEKWILDDKDIKEMLMNNIKLEIINKKKLSVKTVIDLINIPVYDDDIEKNKDFTNQINNCNFKMQYSMPVFNLKRDKAVMMIKMSSNRNDVNYFYILYKIDNNWNIIAQSNDYTE